MKAELARECEGRLRDLMREHQDVILESGEASSRLQRLNSKSNALMTEINEVRSVVTALGGNGYPTS